MSSYRFGRSDDVPLLADDYNRCSLEPSPGEPATTLADLKRDIREINLWCSSCMVALAGSDPIGILIGAKRPTETLIHRIAVHPDHRRQGHGRHMLASLSAKLAILGPPRLLAEVPSDRAEACALFEACGYAVRARYVDFVSAPHGSPRPDSSLVIPITLEDLIESDVFDRTTPRCWERSLPTLINRRDQLQGLAIASDERIEAYLLHRNIDEPNGRREIVALHEADAARGGIALGVLLRHYVHQAERPSWIPRVSAQEIPFGRLEAWGFRREREYIGYAAASRPA